MKTLILAGKAMILIGMVLFASLAINAEEAEGGCFSRLRARRAARYAATYHRSYGCHNSYRASSCGATYYVPLQHTHSVLVKPAKPSVQCQGGTCRVR